MHELWMDVGRPDDLLEVNKITKARNLNEQ